MIDTKKVRLMTRTALYENGVGKEDLRMNRWKKSTYITMKVLQSLLSITIAYAMAASVYMLRYFYDIVRDGVKAFKGPVIQLLICYLIVMAITWIITYRYYKRKFIEARRRIVQYDKNLEAIDQYLKEEQKKEDLV